MNKKNIGLGIGISIILILSIIFDLYFFRRVKLYSIDKDVKQVWIWDQEEEIAKGWYTEPVTMLYALENKTMVCVDSKVEEQLTVGWYLEPVTKIYSLNESKVIAKSEIDKYINENQIWFEYPVVKLYSISGKQKIFPLTEKEKMLKEQWFETEEKATAARKEVEKKKQQEAKRKASAGKNPFSRSGFSIEQLEKCLSGGLKGYGQAFYNMEQAYGVNAVFAISVAELESGFGTSEAFKNKNNAFGIGPNKYFNNVTESINNFGKLMNKSLYKGKSIDAIGSIYCVGGNWACKVKSLFNKNYAQIGA